MTIEDAPHRADPPPGREPLDNEPRGGEGAGTTAAGGRIRSVARDLAGVVADGGRLWLRHWPVLLTIALLGGAVRMGAIWAATAVSEANNTLGFAVLVLGPLGSVAAIILMLLAMRGSLPALSAAARAESPEDPATHRPRRVMDVLASVLVPFLAVYASYGYLAEDRRRYQNAVIALEFREKDIWSGSLMPDGERVFVATGWVVLAVIAVAVVLRWGLARLEGRLNATPLGFAGAYVEAFWLIVLASAFTSYREELWAWVESRRAIDIVIGWWESFLDLLGPVAGPVDAVVARLVDVLGALDDLVVVPLAWLAVGAVVFGHKLPARPLRVRTPRAVERVPGPVRRWLGQAVQPFVGDLRARFSGLVNGIRQLAVAGLGPMLVFALAFLAAARLEDVLVLAVRALVGPQPVDNWLAFSPHIETVTHAVGLTVTIALLAAAVDRVLGAAGRSDGDVESAPAQVAQPTEGSPTESSR